MDDIQKYIFTAGAPIPIARMGGGKAAILVPKRITANGEYNPADDGADGYSLITVDVPADRLGLSALSYDTINAVCGMAGYAVIGYADVIAGIATFVEV